MVKISERIIILKYICHTVTQRMMDQILERCKGVIGIANDVVIYGDGDEDHNRNLHNFMHRA